MRKNPNSSPNTPLAPWEVATHVATAMQPGLLPFRTCTPLTLGAAILIGLMLWPALGLAALPTALVFGRLLALDVTTYTLPDIYTLPLIAIGLTYAFGHGQGPQAVLVVLSLLIITTTLSSTNTSLGLGGGDMKLLAAMFTFLPLTTAFWAIAVGCLFWMPVAFAKPKAMVPFGVPLVLGWCVMLACPHLPNWLISTIS